MGILQKLTPTSQKLAPILNHELTIEPLEAVKIPCRGVIQGNLTTPYLSIPSSPLVIADLNKYYTVHRSVTYITVLNPTTRQVTINNIQIEQEPTPKTQPPPILSSCPHVLVSPCIPALISSCPPVFLSSCP